MLEELNNEKYNIKRKIAAMLIVIEEEHEKYNTELFSFGSTCKLEFIGDYIAFLLKEKEILMDMEYENNLNIID